MVELPQSLPCEPSHIRWFSGPGVPDYALPRLGERFFTTQRPDGRRSGSGLGLAIVQQVMLLHQGRVRFAQRNPGLQVTLEFRPQEH